MITVDHLSKNYGKVQAVRDLSFTVRDGAVTGFLGIMAPENLPPCDVFSG